MKDISTVFYWNVGTLPFTWRPLFRPTNGEEIPDALSFGLCVNHRTGLLRQTPNKTVSSALSIAYLKGSMISGMMKNEGIGKQYAEDLLSFIRKILKTERMDGLKVLEIGCGTGYLLYRLQQLGAKCLGIEPGKHGQNGVKQYGVQIVNDFFPSKKINGEFDIIIFYGVLEHIENPFNFLIQLKSSIEPNGKILLSVPDCEPYMDVGDISFLFHEHWNYFTRQTLYNTLISVGASEVNIQKSGFGGALYASAQLTSNLFEIDPTVISSEIEKAWLFKKRAQEVTKKLLAFVDQVRTEGKSLAIYVPGRTINALTIGRTDRSHCRFFDDNSLLHGTYFPGINIPIEPRQNLIDNPTDVVLIMSRSFGNKIAKELSSVLPTTIIKTWSDIFA